MEKIFSLKDIDNIAQNIIESIKDNDSPVVAFYGKMGSGKTTLIKAICEKIGVIDTVQSPTFAIINQYQTTQGKSIFHFDFYRLNRLEEAINIGVEDYFYSGQLCLIEWPEIIEPLLPDNTLRIKLDIIDQNRRKITINVTAESINHNSSI